MMRLLRLVPRAGRCVSMIPEMDRVGRFLDKLEFTGLLDRGRKVMPAFDVAETEKEYTITGEIPGVDAKDLEVTLSDGILTVKGEKKEEKEETDEQYHCVERHYGSFLRSFRMPENAKAEESMATYKDGVLKLSIPKAEEMKVQKIAVEEVTTMKQGPRQEEKAA